MLQLSGSDVRTSGLALTPLTTLVECCGAQRSLPCVLAVGVCYIPLRNTTPSTAFSTQPPWLLPALAPCNSGGVMRPQGPDQHPLSDPNIHRCSSCAGQCRNGLPCAPVKTTMMCCYPDAHHCAAPPTSLLTINLPALLINSPSPCVHSTRPCPRSPGSLGHAVFTEGRHSVVVP